MEDAMRTLVLAMIAVGLAGPALAERRCGWYRNPTPGNVILEDADGQWWISRQGSAPAPGFDEAYTAAFDNRVRVDHAGNITDRYGSSCACAQGAFDAAAPVYENVRSIARLTEIPLSRCLEDPALPAP
jgi:Protein of unknown function (DUF4087)